MQIQDAHTHFFGRPFFDGLAALSPRKDEPGLVDAVAAKAGLQLPDADPARHAARWIAEMDKHGVARMVSFASLPGEAEAVAAAARASGGRLIPYTIVNPTDPKAPAFTERALGTLGFRGLLTESQRCTTSRRATPACSPCSSWRRSTRRRCWCTAACCA